MRKRIAKELPKVEIELKKVLENWEDEYGRPFLIHGERYLDELAASSTKAAPPRSKTPSVAAQPAKPAKSCPPGSRGGTLRGAPPPRSHTPTINRNDFSRSVMASSVSTAGARSPSKIPSRAPLSNMPHGNNSPERRYHHDDYTIRKMGPPRAPPPKMKDLFVPPPVTTPSSTAGTDYLDQRSASVVRYVAPEDVYDDRQFATSTSMLRLQSHHHAHYNNPPVPVPASRQISATSVTTANTAVSGSENWETYDDASDPEPEPDASEAYYAKMRAARGKRWTPEDGYTSPNGGHAGKKLRGLGMGRGVGMEMVVMGEEDSLRRIEGSEAGWTDEDAY